MEEPDAGIVNFYQTKVRLILHLDRLSLIGLLGYPDGSCRPIRDLRNITTGLDIVRYLKVLQRGPTDVWIDWAVQRYFSSEAPRAISSQFQFFFGQAT